MPSKVLLLGIAVLSVVIIASGVGWTLINNYNHSTSSSPSPTPQPTVPESQPIITPEPSASSSPSSNDNETLNYFSADQIRDSAMASLATSHPDIANLSSSLTWSGGIDDTGSQTNETYLYYSSGWSVSVEYPIAAPVVYTVMGTYTSDTMYVSFSGTFQNGTFSITYYSEGQITPTPAPSQST